jgi:hypothetical protein
MMKKSGYIQKTGCTAYDSDGKLHDFIELHIKGQRYAVRLSDLAGAITGRTHVQIESLTHNWNYYLGAVAGLAQVSLSGRALNIDLFDAGDFTVSLASLRAVLYGRSRVAIVVKIPETPFQGRGGKFSYGQKHFRATA